MVHPDRVVSCPLVLKQDIIYLRQLKSRSPNHKILERTHHLPLVMAA
jgi:hypothetical protein